MKRSTVFTLLFFLFSIAPLYLTVTTVKNHQEVTNAKFNLKNSLKQSVLSIFARANDSFDEFNNMTGELQNQSGTYSIYIKDLNAQKTYTYNVNEQYYAASLFKLPVGVATLKQIDEGTLSFDTKLTYYARHATDGTGYINQTPYGTEYTVEELLSALFKHSDNTAQSILLEKLNVNSPQVTSVFPSGGKTDFYHINESSAVEIGEYLEYIYTSDLLTADSKRYLFNVMQNTEFDYYLADYLDAPFSNKIGLWGSSVHSCGVIPSKDVIVCVMSSDVTVAQFIEAGKKIASFVNSL